ncbi:MAG: hypothetical protein PHX21_01320 [bacterium]|nr:hypothetical protein [bacterium]
MKKLFIVFVISVTIISADSPSSSFDSQLPDYHLITTSYNQLPSGIGLKPSDLTLTDAYEYNRGKAFASFGGEGYSYDESNGDEDNSWKITEPLGGLAGGLISALLVGGAVGLATRSSDDWSGLILAYYGVFIVYPIGVGTGIWMTGKYREKEKGNLLLSILGAAVGTIPAFFYPPLLLVTPILSGLTVYRLTLGIGNPNCCLGLK